jgi:hypothetical protein
MCCSYNGAGTKMSYGGEEGLRRSLSGSEAVKGSSVSSSRRSVAAGLQRRWWQGGREVDEGAVVLRYLYARENNRGE